jgi:hypothetical protein
MSYDDEKHTLVHLGLANHEEDSNSDYMRKCIEFYEMNKGGVVNQAQILERLARIEAMLKTGVVTVAGDDGRDTAEDYTDEIFDEALEQLDL